MKYVRVYHNVNDDHATRWLYTPGNPVALVFTGEFDCTVDDTALAQVFHLLNVGQDVRARAYRSRRNRSLSTGDVVWVGWSAAISETAEGTWYACTSVGWTPIEAPAVVRYTGYGTTSLDPAEQEAGA